MLKLACHQHFGKKGETLAGMQRSLFEEDIQNRMGLLKH
jgi:hypothetical protein